MKIVRSSLVICSEVELKILGEKKKYTTFCFALVKGESEKLPDLISSYRIRTLWYGDNFSFVWKNTTNRDIRTLGAKNNLFFVFQLKF